MSFWGHEHGEKGDQNAGPVDWNPRWLRRISKQISSLKNEPATRILYRGSDGSDGLGTLTDRAVFTWKSKQYRFVFPKVLVA